ncbi:MAG: hypothetical protein KGI50_03480 [Patescibacteria group bacterium]|nr:hypothetical protein [Patescibacteria group bacterium]MDE2438353.1 hypothetical protein [Patescibacteria group bacterium]
MDENEALEAAAREWGMTSEDLQRRLDETFHQTPSTPDCLGIEEWEAYPDLPEERLIHITQCLTCQFFTQMLSDPEEKKEEKNMRTPAKRKKRQLPWKYFGYEGYSVKVASFYYRIYVNPSAYYLYYGFSREELLGTFATFEGADQGAVRHMQTMVRGLEDEIRILQRVLRSAKKRNKKSK